MNPKKKLPKDSEEIAEIGRYILVKTTLNKETYYQIYEFYESSDGRRYWARGAGNSDFETVKTEMERITGRKIKSPATV
ncbi:MAG: hypothetical protein NWF07_11970 [Candidatus Bathyarchaeota archaeon]|nr:hypothetical protein [Candidatus Bathyarchaeota archaeon]